MEAAQGQRVKERTRSEAAAAASWIRVFDLAFAAAGILLTLPVMLPIAAAIKLGSKGPVFFAQERLGFLKRPFKLVKFRTMRVDAEAEGPRWAGESDERITGVGRFLRRTRLDELPQFFNVLKGEMSMVGPRPIRKHFADLLRQHNPDYDRRFLVKPGVTGWSQLRTSYARTVEAQLERLPYDLSYLGGITPALYFKLIFMTAADVLLQRGE